MSDLDYVRELIDALKRAELSPVLPWAGMGSLVCVRNEDGDMLRISDVVVVKDEVNGHIEIQVVPDGHQPADVHPEED